jgi:hypothetical protein
MKIVLIVIAAAAILGILGGCAALQSKAPVPVSQPVNAFEQYVFTALSDAQAGLAATEAKIKSGELPASLTPDYDRAAVLYNTLVSLLKRYDAAYRAGNDVQAMQTEISQDLEDLLALGLKLWPERQTAPPPVN